MLEIRDLSVSVGHKLVLRDINLSLPEGELHVLMGPNGSGKSSLLAAIMGLPPFEVTGGVILYHGRDLAGLDLGERARLGIGMAYQRPPPIDGVTLRAFARALGASEKLEQEAGALDLAGFSSREMNVGFSGGEIKRWEVLKLFLQDPSLLLFDEPESGVDLEHVGAIGSAIDRLMQAHDAAGQARSGLVITHTGLILGHVRADCGHIIRDGRIIHSGDANEIFAHIRTNGYSAPDASAKETSHA